MRQIFKSYLSRIILIFGSLGIGMFVFMGWVWVDSGKLTIMEVLKVYFFSFLLAGLIGLGIYWASKGE
jgi:hypothetical protein